MNDENAGLAQLARLAILDTSREQAYDDITRMAASLFDVPIALIPLVDSERQTVLLVEDNAACAICRPRP